MKSYRGSASQVAGAKVVEVLEDGEIVGVLRHIPRHSPTGMNWGYGGSGPADLALSLLVDHYGERSLCTGCKGSGRQVWDHHHDRFTFWEPTAAYSAAERETIGACLVCHGDGIAVGPELYQHFKSEVIAKLPQEGTWTMTASDIDLWLAGATVGLREQP